MKKKIYEDGVDKIHKINFGKLYVETYLIHE